MSTTAPEKPATELSPSGSSTSLTPSADARVFESVLDLLPTERNPTPVVRINKLGPRTPSDTTGLELWAKLEWMNPFGSVKDRAASYLIDQLDREGKIRPRGTDSEDDPGKGIVEPTSGNTGLSLASIAGMKGVPMRAVVPNKVPLEKKVMLKIAGADLDVVNDNLCPSPGMGDGSINLAKTYAKAQSNRWAMPNQYENEANVRAHMETTGPEIMRQTGGAVTHVFCSLGTCGTVTGLGRYFRDAKPGVKLYAIQPSAGHDVPGLRNKDELASANLFDESLVEDVLEIDYTLAYRRAAELLATEGLRAGPSSGLIFEGAARIARSFPEGETGVGVMIFCDDVFRYVHNMIHHLPELAEGTAAPNT